MSLSVVRGVKSSLAFSRAACSSWCAAAGASTRDSRCKFQRRHCESVAREGRCHLVDFARVVFVLSVGNARAGRERGTCRPTCHSTGC
eukprot:3402709-Rhodomonas_salina.1